MESFRLRVFRAVARHLNFRLAAEEVLLTQPAVTQQIKALESEFSVALFERAGGRVKLTPAGEALLPYAERLATISAEAREAVMATTGGTAGRLVVGASQTIGQYLLPRVIAAVMLMAVYRKPERPARSTWWKFMPKPSAMTETCKSNLARELDSRRSGCSTVKPKAMPPTSAIGGETRPLAASRRPRKKMIFESKLRGWMALPGSTRETVMVSSVTGIDAPSSTSK